MSQLSEMNLLQEKPLVKTIQDHVVNYLKFPKGGVWLQELVTVFKLSYNNTGLWSDPKRSSMQSYLST
jgi:hypothetical protein